MADPGTPGSYSRRRRRHRACAPHWNFPAVGVELDPRTRRARSLGGERDRRRPRGFAARSLRRDTDIDDVRSSRARRNTRCLGIAHARSRRRASETVGQLHGDATPLGAAHIESGGSRKQMRRYARSSANIFDLFIGVGRGELLPYASYYLTGFLHERPLARLREDLAALGIERAEGVAEPEDHAGDPVRDHGRPGQRRNSGAGGRGPRICSKNIWRPGSAVSSPIWSAPKRRILPARRHCRPGIHRNRNGGFRAAGLSAASRASVFKEDWR